MWFGSTAGHGQPDEHRQPSGTMRERTPGHWELRAFSGRDPVSGKPRQATRTFVGGEWAAAKALSKPIADVGAGKFNRSSATLGPLLD